MFPSIKKRQDPLLLPKLWNFYILGLKVKFTQSCPSLWDPMDCSLPGSSVHWILRARILEWVAIPFSQGSSQLRDWTQVSHIVGRIFTIWATREAQEYWSGLSIPSPTDVLTQELNQGLLHCRRILYQLSYQDVLIYFYNFCSTWWKSFRLLFAESVCR